MRPSRCHVWLGNLRRNYRWLRERVPNAAILAVVKANAYGHGAMEVARVLVEEGCAWFGVATAHEALELRQGGIEGPILLLGTVPPHEIELALWLEVSFTVSDFDYLELIRQNASLLRKTARLHLKVDVGMGRQGILPHHALELAQAGRQPWLEWEGLMTHFSHSDSPDVVITERQHRVFCQTHSDLQAAGFSFPWVHAANSAALIDHPKTHHNLVRPGIALYGYAPRVDHPLRRELRPVMELRAPVLLVKRLPAGSTLSYGGTYTLKRESLVAVVGVGYADGYHRALSNKGRIRLGSKMYRVRGRVCMDQILVTVDEKVQRWQDAMVFGPSEEGPDGWDLAKLIGTIPYEITSSISNRIPRIYSEEERWYRA